VQVSYRTLGSWATGFTGQLTISNHSKHHLTGWHLAISYKNSRITGVSGARWIPRSGGASGTVEPASSSDPLGAGTSVRISYTATGTPHAPAACDFNGTRCTVR
jgi:hypothetical protein